jgi:hypothetical protein
MALGGDVQVRARRPADGRLTPECLNIERSIADIQTRILDVQGGIDGREAQKREAIAERDQALNDLDAVIGDLGLRINPTIRNLSAVRREVNNLPDDAGPNVQRALRSIEEALTANSRLKEHEKALKGMRDLLLRLRQTLRIEKIRFGREC